MDYLHVKPNSIDRSPETTKNDVPVSGLVSQASTLGFELGRFKPLYLRKKLPLTLKLKVIVQKL
jgi:hypothetical protein